MSVAKVGTPATKEDRGPNDAAQPGESHATRMSIGASESSLVVGELDFGHGARERRALVDDALKQQAVLSTAVSLFSDWHETHEDGHAQARHYRNLIPLTKPVRGEQYAFEVNLDQCTGCKACVVACHSLNGLDDDESWRDIGLLLGDDYTPYQQTVTTACHHCADPACSNGCPVLAYDKDEATGIVRHLDDQCIGCSYCQMKCPYDVPKLNKKRGIVRKCDMCQQRLAVGEAPACVQSCPNGAITIRIVKASELAEEAPYGVKRLLPGTAMSNYTHPSTRYISSKPVPETIFHADAARPRIEVAHTPLAIMLVLTQLATGVLVFSHHSAGSWTAFATAALGIGASVLHLGQPLKAWRCFLGLRKSWLSREIVAFGAFAPAALAVALGFIPQAWAAAIGVISVFCSVMVYVDTRRPSWVMSQTLPRFAGTVLVLGSSFAACFDPAMAGVCALLSVLKLCWEALLLSLPDENLDRTKRLLLGPLRDVNLSRVIIALLGISITLVAPVLGFVLLAAGEFIERSLFFKSAAAWKMPGNA